MLNGSWLIITTRDSHVPCVAQVGFVVFMMLGVGGCLERITPGVCEGARHASVSTAFQPVPLPFMVPVRNACFTKQGSLMFSDDDLIG